MNYSEFVNRLNASTTGSAVREQTSCCGQLVQETVQGVILIDRKQTEFTSINQARDAIKQSILERHIHDQIQQEQYLQISPGRIADIIRQHHGDVRVTDTLVESYVELASSKLFTVDPIANDIRNLSRINRLIESHVDFQLDDGSVVVISEDAQNKINNMFAAHSDIVNHMKSSKQAFLDVLNQIEE